ncbi:poly(3-hydroxyalkanoate) depolymerase [Roseateles koreensis]|uniref:Poly(3-hydroxyalkanoate) depolymerase n=1 Tax=Roseateles koreensis TaxID=2987526 RepID=A0ABT5KLM7_9BURK|nr:poly(3-hydroxyalkanoate) depolymerase [Roseateles koreensis]MDC8783793.1 poly(3-hydroxyalkanoate) depolymerase [Roseateles koreensis]
MQNASTLPRPAAHDLDAVSAAPPQAGGAFNIEMLHVGAQVLRVGRQPGLGRGVPLLLFNGIGGNIELLAPLARALPEREVITFDIPGVGHSLMPKRPYRLDTIIELACGVLDHFGHKTCDVLGISWGGGAAQEFAHTAPDRCRRLILCATATGVFMVPARPSVLLKMATPRRYISRSYIKQISGDIYGGDFRANPGAAAQFFGHVKWQSKLGYYLQIAAMTGWTSIHWLHRLNQPTLVMAGNDDPLIPLINARLMNRLIPNSELKVFDCGHLFLLTRMQESVSAIREFLQRP